MLLSDRNTQQNLTGWMYWPALFLTLLFAFYLRTVGLDWDEGQQLHPDERFLNMVQNSVEWVPSIDAYFDTEHSTLNPHNKGHGFYVYGTLPLFIVRGAMELLGPSLQRPHMIGRWLSVMADMLTVLFTFLIAARLYNRRAALVAAMLVACCVTQIQQAHFGVVDAFTGFCTTVALYLAVCISTLPHGRWLKLMLLSVTFGVVVGCAASSKIPAVLISLWIAPALLIRSRDWKPLVFCSAVAACVCLVTIRITQPYAFSGPGFFGVTPNPKWVANIKELANQGQLSFGFPPAIQWMERDKSYAFVNMYEWGVGELSSLLILAALLFFTYRIVRHKEWGHALPLSWALVAFGYFGVLTINPTLRYQIPAYPGMFVCAGALAALLLRSRIGAFAVSLVLIYSALWGIAFTRIYTRTHSRIAASNWIVRHIPGAVNLVGYDNNEKVTVPIPVPSNFVLLPGETKSFNFGLSNPFGATGILLPMHGLPERDVQPELTTWLKAGPTAMMTAGRGRFGDSEVVAQFADVAEVHGYTPYQIDLQSQGHTQPISIRKFRMAHETQWDDGLPMRVMGLDPYGGIYDGDLLLEMYWEESPETIKRYATVLGKADYLFLTSNRQWGSVGRLAHHFPSAQKFYRALLNCDPKLSVPECYARVSEPPGELKLGYKLEEVFESFPSILGFQFNDQLADEAFSVYDHPKVLLFKNERRFDAATLEKIIAAG